MSYVQSARYLAGERWYDCDRCGFSYPESQTIIEDWSGLRVCIERCLDPDPESFDYTHLTPYSEK